MQEVSPVGISSGITTLSAALSALAVIFGAVVAFVVLRMQRDMANLKDEILAGINGKYISRREHDIVEKNNAEWRESADESLKETRSRHHTLHEEFIACRASHSGVGGH